MDFRKGHQNVSKMALMLRNRYTKYIGGIDARQKNNS